MASTKATIRAEIETRATAMASNLDEAGSVDIMRRSCSVQYSHRHSVGRLCSIDRDCHTRHI